MTTAAHQPDRCQRIRQALTDAPQITPLLPLIYLVWADGELIDEELATLEAMTHRQPWLDEADLELLAPWLDAEAPPTAAELQGLLATIGEAAEQMGHPERLSLAELGAQLAAHYGGQGVPVSTADIRTALVEVEQSLGLVGDEAARHLQSILNTRPTPPTPEVPEPSFDVAAMSALLDGRHHNTRDEVRQLLTGDDFEYRYDLPLDEYREQVMTWLEHLVDAGLGQKCFPPVVDDHRDLGEFLAIFETLGIFDLSLLVKFGVQFGLFGGSIMFLGTEEHHEKYLPRIAALDLQGCYAMTEMGRGSNVRDLETTARYDSETDEFVIHTPTETARKEWIGGAGQYATIATVYAQLIVDGEHHGVHAFLVPIRDDQGQPLDGVRLQDQGLKMGLNGVDNGRIWFNHVRIPRKNLLNRYGRITDDGAYDSPIPSPDRRFFTMLGTLVAGRLGVSAGGISAAKVALAIATRYGANRRQFGPAGQDEVVLLDYRMHQRALMPAIAESYALTFGLHELMDRYNDADDANRRHTEALAAGLKARSSWFAIDAVQTSREACGGQGYLTLNRLPAIRTDVDVFATFEGANMVMMQQVARARLANFTAELNDGNFFAMARLIGGQARRAVAETNPVITRNTDTDHLLSAEFQRNALSYREQDLVVSLGRRLKKRIDDGMDSFLAFNDCQDHAVTLANAHIESFLVDAFADREQEADEDLRPTLAKLRSLFALSCLQSDMAWFLENGYVQPAKARAIRDLINQLCAELRENALALVDAYAIPDACISAPIAFTSDKAPAEARPDFARGVADN